MVSATVQIRAPAPGARLHLRVGELVEVRSEEEILATLRRLSEQGLGIVIVSSELEEVVAISHRILVLAEGRVVATLDRAAAPIRVEDVLHAAFRVGE